MNTTEQLWRPADGERLSSPDEVHIWRTSLDLSSFQSEVLLRTLSVDEVERANRYHFEKDKNRFIAARGILRNILRNYVGMNADKIQFEYAPNGKPLLQNNPGSATVSFNLSHSGAFALYAVTLHRRVGIDIEKIRQDVDVPEIARRFFSEAENSSLEQTPKNRLHELFFQYWTRKEAFLKAIGAGISFPMEKVEVSAGNGSSLTAIALPSDDKENTCWDLHDLFPVAGYAAAVAIERGQCDLSLFHYAI